MRRAGRFCGAGALVLAIGCGAAEEAPRPSGAAMSGTRPPRAENAANGAPVIARVRLEPEEPVPGGRVRALVEARDPDGDALRLRYVWTVGGVPAGGDAADLALGHVRKGDELEVTVLASDGQAESAPARARAVLGNRPPLLTGIVLEPADGIPVGGRVKAFPEAQDADDDTLRYEVEWLVNGAASGEDGLEFEARGLRQGDRIEARVRASDGRVTTAPVVSRAVVVGNSPPEITSRPPLRFDGAAIHYDVEARDPDGDPQLRFSLLQAPPGMEIDRFDGTIRWTPSPAQTGRHTVEVAVEDSHGGKAAQSFQVTIGSEPSPGPAAAPQE